MRYICTKYSNLWRIFIIYRYGGISPLKGLSHEMEGGGQMDSPFKDGVGGLPWLVQYLDVMCGEYDGGASLCQGQHQVPNGHPAKFRGSFKGIVA